MAKPKVILLVVCCLCFISAVIMLSVGAASYDAESDNVKLIGVGYRCAFGVLIAAGVIGVITFILGLIATLKDVRVLIKVFLGFIFVVFILAFVAGILGFVYYGKVDKNIIKNLKSALDKYGVTGESEMTNTWKIVQKKKDCCAVHYYTDWRKTVYAHNRYDKVPQSCCKKGSSGCTGYEFKIDQVANKGCLDPLRTAALNNLQGVGITGMIFAVVELILFILGAVYFKKLVGKEEGSRKKTGREMKGEPVPTSEPDHRSKPSEFL